MLVHDSERGILHLSLGPALCSIHKQSSIHLLLPVGFVDVAKDVNFGFHFLDSLPQLLTPQMDVYLVPDV